MIPPMIIDIELLLEAPGAVAVVVGALDMVPLGGVLELANVLKAVRLEVVLKPLRVLGL